MGARQRDWAKRKLAALLELLGGECADCGSPDNLQVDHVDGRAWIVDRVEFSARVSRYWQEFRAGVRLRALCGTCNASRGATMRYVDREAMILAGDVAEIAARSEQIQAELDQIPF